MSKAKWLRDNARTLNIANASALEEFADDFEQLEAKIERLKPFEQAMKSRHNGYDLKIECEPPKTPLQALDELLGEAELLGCSKREIELEAENKKLKEDLAKYGIHSAECEIARRPFLSVSNAIWECTCGFEQALKG